jgi:hypothetical protein
MFSKSFALFVSITTFGSVIGSYSQQDFGGEANE